MLDNLKKVFFKIFGNFVDLPALYQVKDFHYYAIINDKIEADDILKDLIYFMGQPYIFPLIFRQRYETFNNVGINRAGINEPEGSWLPAFNYYRRFIEHADELHKPKNVYILCKNAEDCVAIKLKYQYVMTGKTSDIIDKIMT